MFKHVTFMLLCLLALDVHASCNQKEADEGIQPALNECAHERYLGADKELNATYKKIMDELKAVKSSYADDNVNAKKTADILKQTQLAWLKYRDAQCKAEAFQFDGGSAEPMVHASCLESLTNMRIKEIKTTYEIR